MHAYRNFLHQGVLILGVIVLTCRSGMAAQTPLTGDHIPTQQGDLVIHPVNHATLVLGWNHKTIYVDPVGGQQRFSDLPRPDLILLTDIHGDHLSADTLTGIVTPQTHLVAPPAVIKQLPSGLGQHTTVMTNGQIQTVIDIPIEAIPMYNTTPGRLQYHTKGRGNGYLLSFGGKRVYIAGDTEDVPEMRALKNIDVAFIPMNLPYTMTPQQAASAVNQFKPKIVYPYHYRGTDLQAFKNLVDKDLGIEVRLYDWYKKP